MATLIVLCLSVSVPATTLWLSTNVDLLAPGSKKVSNSSSCGTDSIELDNRPRQLVFRVEKTIRLSSSEEQLYISPPLVVSFNTQLVNQVSSRPPHPENEREANYLNAAPRLELLDSNTTPIPVELDTLATTSTAKTIDYETEAERYNKSIRRVSLPQSATMVVDNSTLLSGISELDAIPPQLQVLTKQRLRY